jgi:cytochrome c oxidase accessory protein FixG
MSAAIYPQRFNGKYRVIKDIVASLLLFIYMAGAWITYERGYGMPNQAILIDLPQRKAYLFGIIIWPDELYYLTFLLILGAIGLFICTTLFGRVWCGYTCPHTTMVDVFIMVERIFQGDRNARIKLDSEELSSVKFIKKSLTHIVWLILSFLFGFGWVGYFYDVKLLSTDILHFKVTSNGLLWLLALTFTTYVFAGFLREKVCVYMCPYGRFQSGLIDSDTILVTYHDWRGEPRGKDDSSGDCINCYKCVVACPMGIDIRNGLQMPCIGCGLCVDACDEVMSKLERPRGLIEYTSANASKILQENWQHSKNTVTKVVLSHKVILYCGVFLIALCTLMSTLIFKKPVIFQVDKENLQLFTLTADRNIRNTYNIYILNKMPKPQNHLCLSIKGLPNALLNVQALGNKYEEQQCFSLKPGEAFESQVFVLEASEDFKNATQNYFNFDFVLQAEESFPTRSIFYIRK